jgi:hypothetical protein
MNTILNRKSGMALEVGLIAMLFLATPVTRAQNPGPGQTVDAQGSQGQAPNMPGQSPDMQDQAAPNDDADPPSRVARISFLDGSVSMQPGGVGDWGAASMNRPVTIGDKLWTDLNSRLELQAGEASIHLGSMTALSFLNLDEMSTQMRLAEGRINFRVREMREGDLYELDSPNMAFTVKQAGAFRVDVNENGDATNVTVIRGLGEVSAAGQTYTLHAGERATITGMDNAVKYEVHAAPMDADELDKWADQRDLREENSESAKHVSREVIGYSDLDDNGTWSEEPNVGSVWYPNSVSPGWAPYSYGYWNWVGPWGWTWIDYSPWGFAPYHYGRWIYGGGRWGWAPGPIYARAYYGPAFVGFLGGVHVGIGFGVGVGVGWFPLGWGEPFHPWYHAGPGYWNNINVHNTYISNVNVINHGGSYNYAYAHNTNAVTVASHSAFENGQAIHRTTGQVTAASLRGATVSNRVNATPNRSSYLGAQNLRGNVAAPSSSVQNRAVMARTTPAAAASNTPVHTMNSSALNSGRSNATGIGNIRGTNTTTANNRAGVSSTNGANTAANGNRQQQLAANRPRTWSAQGNATDSGHAPQGFGANRASVNSNNAGTARVNNTNRPPTLSGNTGNTANTRSTVNRPATTPNVNHTNSAPRTYSPPAAPHTSSAPHNSGGGSAHPSSGGGSHPSGGAPHGGGGGGGGHHR